MQNRLIFVTKKETRLIDKAGFIKQFSNWSQRNQIKKQKNKKKEEIPTKTKVNIDKIGKLQDSSIRKEKGLQRESNGLPFRRKRESTWTRTKWWKKKR